MKEKDIKTHFTLPEHLAGYMLDGVEIIEIEKDTREIFESPQIIGLTEAANEKNLIYYAAKNELWHVISKDSACLLDELLLSLTMLDSTLDVKVEGLVDNMKKRPFNLYQFENSMEIPFHKKSDWDKIINAYEIFSGALPKNEIVRNVIPFVLDEFFTNAIFNSPLGKMKGWEGHRSNTKDDVFKFVNKGMIRIAYGAEHVFIECMDPFGTFNPLSMLKCIKTTYEVGIADAIRNDANKGAGIGLRLVWDRSISMGALVSKDNFCTFFSVIPYRIPSKMLATHPKNFHLVLR